MGEEVGHVSVNYGRRNRRIEGRGNLRRGTEKIRGGKVGVIRGGTRRNRINKINKDK